MSGSQQTAECFFEYRQVGTAGWTETPRQDIQNASPFSDVVSELETGTEYEYRAVAEAGSERAAGDVLRFVATDEGGESAEDAYVSNPGAFSVTLNMGLSGMTSDLVEVWFRYRPVGSDTWIETPRHILSEPGPFPGGDITGLQDDTQYEYQGLVETYVQDHSVQIDPVTSLDFDGVTLNGELTELYGPRDTTVGFVYGPDGSDLSDPEEDPDVESVAAATLGDPGTFSYDVTGLEDGTDYDAQAYSQATILTGNPNTYLFTTDPAVDVEAVTATNFSQTSVTLRGNLRFQYYDSAVEVSVEYREAGASSWTQSSTQTRWDIGEYEIDITGLTAGTEYEWRARVDVPSEGRTETSDSRTFTSGSAGTVNLATELPQRAIDIYNEAPDDARDRWPHEDVTIYAGRNGDLANGINATASNAIADLGSNNTYEISSEVDTDDVVGLAGENCTIVVNKEQYVMPMGGSNHNELAIQGVEFDLSETRDASILTTFNGGVQDYIFIKDVTISGKRGRQVVDYNAQAHTFLVQVASGGEAYVENYTALDGSTEVSGTSRSYAVGASADPAHQGYAVWKDCEVRRFMGNGFYLQNAPGTSVLWNCVAQNNALTNMRLGEDDVVVGGRSEVNNNYPYTEQVGTLLGGNGEQWADVVGLTLIAEGDMMGSAGVRTWTGDKAGGLGGPIRRSTYHKRSGDAPAFRIHSARDPNIEIEDLWMLDESGANITFDISDWSSQPGTVTLNNGVQMDSNSGTDFRIGSDGTLIDPDGVSHSGVDLSASDIGIDATLSVSDFPDYYFDLSVV